jgi:hypothetical protein
MLGGVDEPHGRAVQVGASHRVSAFDVAQRDVAGMTQESSDALSTRSVLLLAARVIMVRIPIESDHLFRSNPIADSGVSDHLAGAGVS